MEGSIYMYMYTSQGKWLSTHSTAVREVNKTRLGSTYITHDLEFVQMCPLSVDQLLDVLLSLNLIRPQALHHLQQVHVYSRCM